MFKVLSLPFALAFLVFGVTQAANNTLSEPAVAALPLCAQECLVKAFMICVPPCALLDMDCACKCLPFQATADNCTQSSCSSSYLETVSDMIAKPCKLEPVPNIETTTSSTTPSTAKHTSPSTTETSASSATSGLGQSITAAHTTLPQTTYTNPAPDQEPSGTGTVTVYGSPTPCSPVTSKPSDCGPLINPLSKAVIEFDGAAGANYSVEVMLDDSIIITNNVLSISSIRATIDVPYLCALETVDYPVAFVEGLVGTWAIGAPQTVVSIACGRRNTNIESSVVLLGIGEAKFSNGTSSTTTSESYVRGEGLNSSVLWSLGLLLLVLILM